MNCILDEKQYQKFILEYLKNNNDYAIRKDKDFDRLFACDREMLFKFLYDTQAKKMDTLSKIYKKDFEDTLVNYINNEMNKNNGSLLDVLKHGIEISNIKLDLMYTKPATLFNKELIEKYEKNIFSVIEEVWASDKERIDLVIFLNGLPIMTFELKCNMAGQSYEDAIYQYRNDRNPKTRLFLFKSGVLVNFAMDLEEVYMTTKLDGNSTFFLPFNMGSGEGIQAGSGNPLFEDKYSVSYMWEDVLKKDSILELISKFIFIETKEKVDETTGKKKITETIIFPRYHQRDAIRKILDDVYVNGSNQNYLIQHSAGSGKTNTIAWTAYRLSSLHDENNKIIFDNIIIVTDRVVVDRQLQAAIMKMEHKSGLIKVMDDKCTSSDLAIALNSNTKIIATTIQKFPYIIDEVSNLKDKKFAVIIDEAHSSTSGKNMAAITQTLGSGEISIDEISTEDMIIDEISKNGKQDNVSMFAFTATPKPTTLNMFGRVNIKGQREAFHIYSMKQAIEEGFILDVLQNYITYKTYYQINKEIEEDPKCKTNSAKRQIARFVELHETNISQRVEVIIEHFRTTVMNELGGNAKAMVIAASREGAVKYRKAFEDYVTKKGYDNIHALVAFSGKVTIKNDSKEYTEVGINGFSEDKLPSEFDKKDYRVLLVANKYQTGFDQPKLCAMYILKKLNGVNAVQTLSRLNRIYPPYDKKTFILDFVNDYDDITKAFSLYYTTTLLSNSVTPNSIYDIEAKLDGYNVIDPMYIEETNKLLYKEKITAKEKQKLTFMFQKSKKEIEKLDELEQKECIVTMRRLVRFYEFLIQVSCFEDVEIHKKYNYISFLLAYVNIKHPGTGYNLDGKITAMNFVQKKTGENKKSKIKSNPVAKLPTADKFILTEDKEEKLSEIIAEINSVAGKTYDNDVAVKAMLQIRDIMMKSEKLKTSAKSNTSKDFEFAYFDNIDDALIEGLEQNQDFFSLLLGNEEMKKKVLGIFSEEIYNSLKDAE